MAEGIWFGTRQYMQFVKAPAVGVQASKVGWETSTQLLNGKKHVRRSLGAHKEYQLSWNMSAREDLQPIMDYADGIYGTGKVYWIDPFVMRRNLFNTEWSVPSQGAYGGTVLSGSDARPSVVPTTPNSLGYPVESALFTVKTADTKPEFWIPIPPGYELLLGAHGQTGSGGKVQYAVTNGEANGPSADLTLLPVTGTQRFNARVSGSGVSVFLGGSGTITLTSLQAVLVPTGLEAPSGGFVSGGGHAGVTFVSQPVLEQYSAALDKVALSATLIEAL